MNLFIFSEDLRIRDNKALYEASLEQKGLIALYIINKGKNEEHGDSLAKLKLKLLALAEIRNPLVSLNIPIKILHSQDIKDEPKEILGFLRGVTLVAKKLGISINNGNGYRTLSNIGSDGGQEVPHLHFHIFEKNQGFINTRNTSRRT